MIINGEAKKIFHLKRLQQATTEAHTDIKYFNEFYSATEAIDAFELVSDTAPETYPPAQLLEKVTEFKITQYCTSFKEGSIQEQLNHLTNVEEIFLYVSQENIGKTALVDLALLNQDSKKVLKIFVLTDEMIDYISKTLTEATRLIIKKVEIEYIRIGGGGRKVVLGGR